MPTWLDSVQRQLTNIQMAEIKILIQDVRDNEHVVGTADEDCCNLFGGE
jgi:hypothetical protein